MAKELLHRRGTTAQHAVFTGKSGELTVDTTKKTVVVHDNVTAGGVPLATESALTSHTGNSLNPHGVTKAQVGLSNVDNTSDMNKPLSNAAIELRDSVNQVRADKYLASQDIASMIYSSGILTKIQYNNPSDIDYEVLSYSSGALTNIAHYVNTVLKGNTVLSYIDGSLSSVVFMEV